MHVCVRKNVPTNDDDECGQLALAPLCHHRRSRPCTWSSMPVAVDDGVCARVGVHCLDNARVPPALALVVRLDGLSLPERERSSVALRRCAIPDPASQHTLFPGSVVVREGEQTVGTGGDRTGVVSAVSAPVTLHPKSCSAWSSVSVCARSSRLSSNLEWIDVVLRVAVVISDVVTAWAVDR